MNPNNDVLVLRFPGILRPIFLVAAAVGFFAIFQWGIPVYTKGAPPPHKWIFTLMLLAPIGTGFLLMTFQSIEISIDCIESRFLGFRRRLDTSTTRVIKIQSNGYTLRDSSGRKLFVHNFLSGSDQLLLMLKGRE